MSKNTKNKVIIIIIKLKEIISIKFSGKLWLMITMKVTKKQGFTLSLEDTFFEKPQGTSSALG